MAAGVNDQVVAVPYRWIAIGASALSVSAMASLAIVASVTDADALSTVALGLAVLAFVIQIVTFIAQLRLSIEQMQQADSVYAETRAVLSEIRATAEGTSVLMGGQFDKLLNNVLASTTAALDDAAVKPEGIDISALRERLAEDIQHSIRDAWMSTVNPQPSALAVPPHDKLPTPPKFSAPWPDDTQTGLLVDAGIADLSEAAIDALELMSKPLAEAPSAAPTGISAAGLGRRVLEELETKGFVRITSSREDHRGSPQIRLTSTGRIGARLFLARPPVPKHVADRIRWLSSRTSGSS